MCVLELKVCVCEKEQRWTAADRTSTTPVSHFTDVLGPDTDEADKKHISEKQNPSPRGGNILKMKRATAPRPMESHVKRFRFLPICRVLTFS